jgi:HSP20 family protein
MSLVKWAPLNNIESMFDNYVRSLGWPLNGDQELISKDDWTPRVDISETDTELVIKADIPDVKKEDVKVSVEEGVLTIQGEKKQEREESGKKYHRIERFYGNFSRSFTLPSYVNEGKIEASFKNGVLQLHIPKTAQSAHKNIEIKVD